MFYARRHDNEVAPVSVDSCRTEASDGGRHQETQTG